MAVVPGTIGQYPTVQHGLVPFLAGQGAKTLGFVDGVATLGCVVAALALMSAPIDAAAALACPVIATARLALAPSGAADVGDLNIGAVVRLNAETVRNV